MLTTIQLNRNPLSVFLSWFFERMKDHGIEYLVLRNYESLPTRIEGSDIDLLVTKVSYSTIRKEILTQTGQTGYRPWKRYHKNFGMIQESFVTEQLLRPHEVIRIDFLIDDVQWMGRSIIPSKKLWAHFEIHNDIRILAPGVSAKLSCLNNLLYAGEIKQKYIEQFNTLSPADQTEAVRCISRQADTLDGLLRMRLLQVRKNFMLKNGIPVEALFRAVFSWCRTLVTRLFHPPGDFIVMIGPDGSGKSTLINMIQEECQRMYPGISSFHLFPKLKIFSSIDKKSRQRWELRQSFGKGEQALRNQSFGLGPSIARLIYLWLRFSAGYFFLVIPKKLKGELVIADRWCFDLIIDPGSKGIRLPNWIIRPFFFFIPKPSGNLLLLGSPAIFASRKEDLSADEIQRQLVLMQRYFSRSRRTRQIRTDQQPEESFREALDFLVRSQIK